MVISLYLKARSAGRFDLYNGQRLGGTLVSTFATSDALERLDLIAVIPHRQVRAKAHAGQTPHTQLLFQSDDTPFIP